MTELTVKYLEDEILRLTQEMKEKSESRYEKEYENLWEERIATKETLANLLKKGKTK